MRDLSADKLQLIRNVTQIEEICKIIREGAESDQYVCAPHLKCFISRIESKCADMRTTADFMEYYYSQESVLI